MVFLSSGGLPWLGQELNEHQLIKMKEDLTGKNLFTCLPDEILNIVN